MNKQELKDILDSHLKWLRGGEGGVRANLEGADLKDAKLWSVILEYADLENANLQDADLRRANLEEADLEYANLRGANLWGVNLQDADLEYANLRGANLECADLEGADLRGAILDGANLRGANLRGANLESADLFHADLNGANYISQWQSPQGVRRICYSVKHDNCVMHKLGCFWGDTEQAIEAIREKYGNDSMYEQLLVLNAQALEVE